MRCTTIISTTTSPASVVIVACSSRPERTSTWLRMETMMPTAAILKTRSISMIAGAIASAVYPLTGYGALYNQLSNYNLTLWLERVSPYYLFCEAISTILNPNVRSLGITSMEPVGKPEVIKAEMVLLAMLSGI